MAAALAICALAGAARAADGPSDAPLTLELRNTTEAWRNLQGGLGVGNTTLDKVQFSLRFSGDAIGWTGFSAYLQMFKTNAESLSLARTGDVQTVSNIEAPETTRLFELWASKDFGDADRPGWVALRAGLIDFNRTFDSIDPAGLFINSSHGIGPDLSRSSPTGPSIFSVAGPSAQADWRPAPKLVVQAGVFGVPDAGRQARLVDLRIAPAYGAIAVGQLDYAFAKDAQASVGLWRYTAAEPTVADPAQRIQARPGVYGFVEGPTPLPGRPSGWVRAGLADRRVQAVAAYAGGGLVWKGAAPGRPGDAFGLAIAHAVIGGPARAIQGLPAAETTLEATYSIRLGKYLHLQPDVQHILHPALAPKLPNATVVGLRLVAFARAPASGGDD